MIKGAPRGLRQCLGLILLALLWATQGQAEVGPWQDIPKGQVRLLVAEGQDGDTPFGVDIHLEPGWKIYWEYAGPVGQPTVWRFDGLGAGQDATLFLPWPKRSRLQGYPSYGYEGQITLPGLIEGPANGGTVQLGLSICSQTQCIPHRTQLALPSGQVGPDPLVVSKLRRAFANVPVPVTDQATLVPTQGVQSVRLLGLKGEDFLVSADQTAARAGFFLKQAHVLASGDLTAPYEIRASAEDLTFLADARVFLQTSAGAFVFDDRDLRTHGRLAQSLSLTIPTLTDAPAAQPPQEPAQKPPTPSLVWSALLLFAGGFLLNFMPCVLPVLFLKLKSALLTQGDAGARTRALRRSFGWTAVGIVGAFVILGLLMASLQTLTGFQLTLGAWMQWPQTTLLLTALMVLFIANAMGWFEFVVPARLLNLGAGHQGVLGHILAGVVAALMGGACAGVLMAAALGVAFTQGPAVLVFLLTLMGLGLALPYLLALIIPQVARVLPKPGPWMTLLKPIMGHGLILTWAFLVFVLSKQITTLALIATIALSIAALGSLYARQKYKGWDRAGAWVATISVLVMALALPWFARQPSAAATRAFDAEIAALVAKGDRVLVDVTAFWCVTCLTNKSLVLNTIAVETYMAETGTILYTINADLYTEEIAAFVASHDRASLPLNVLYSPRFPGGEVLPSVLTKDAVRSAIDSTL